MSFSTPSRWGKCVIALWGRFLWQRCGQARLYGVSQAMRIAYIVAGGASLLFSVLRVADGLKVAAIKKTGDKSRDQNAGGAPGQCSQRSNAFGGFAEPCVQLFRGSPSQPLGAGSARRSGRCCEGLATQIAMNGQPTSCHGACPLTCWALSCQSHGTDPGP